MWKEKLKQMKECNKTETENNLMVTSEERHGGGSMIGEGD